MVGLFEISELIALAVMVTALLVMVRVRAHPANTPRTRQWWGRFVAVLLVETISLVCTNLEQVFPEHSTGNIIFNLTEHLFAMATGMLALMIVYHALRETQGRLVEGGEGV